MSYIGNTNTSQGFIPAVDYFSGNGSTLAFTLSKSVATVYQIEVVIDNVIQNPSSSYTVLNNVITFSSAPLTGTNNIWVRYVSLNTSVVQPGVGTVGTNQLGDVNAINSFTSLAFKTNVGVERMRIDASGNVGIGTSSPAARLHAYGSTTNASIIRTELGGGADGVYFEIKGGVNYRSLTASTGAGAIDWAVGQYGTATGQNLAFYTGTTERMRIDSVGNVGIGTSSPVTPLQIKSPASSLIGLSVLVSGESNTERIGIRSSSSGGGTSVYIAASSRGTATTPEATQSGDVTGYYQFGGYNGSIWTRGAWITGIAAETWTTSSQSSSIAFSTTPIGSIVMAERMRIDSSGNLLVGTTSASVPSTTGFVSSANTFGFKNRIINGGMVIDQRNAGASVSVSGAYPVDRFVFYGSQSSKLTLQQNAGAVTPPTGFGNYLGVTSSSAYSVLSTDEFSYLQAVEGFNIADLGWGTASAVTVTLSFWVRSSLTGTFGGSLRNGAVNRSYPFSYTVSAANTWEQKSITIAGDTSGTWLATNGVGIYLSFGLGVGSTKSGSAGSWTANNYISATGATSVVGTSGATFYITGVQLEKGSVATSFDQRAYNQELAMCQRYYQTSTQAVGYASAAGSIIVNQYFPTPMRATPSLALASTTPYIENIPWATVSTTSGCSVNNGHMGVLGGDMLITGTMSGIATNQFVLLGVNQVKFSAEL